MQRHEVGQVAVSYRQINGYQLHIKLSHLDEELRKKVSKLVRQCKHVKQSRLTKQGEIICVIQKNGRTSQMAKDVLDLVAKKIARHEKPDSGGSNGHGRSGRKRRHKSKRH
ncbi:MAG TPA: hypothetical protein VFX84_04005 [Candidatus Saccharimonadales bacterium]|nr:hypothetical protein [Candidatus Saccharimonadales bacterium]